MKNSLNIIENKNEKNNPKIFVACLASYNRGYLNGRWIDANQDEETIYEEIRQILMHSPKPNAEQWIILEHEGFYSLAINEYETIESVCEKTQFIQQYGELGAALNDYYGDMEKAQAALDNYCGEWDREIDFAIDLFDQIYADNISENIRRYIDYNSFIRDIFRSDYFSLDVDGRVHIFSNH